jgi:hypothetical protein
VRHLPLALLLNLYTKQARSDNFFAIILGITTTITTHQHNHYHHHPGTIISTQLPPPKP